MTSRDFAYWLQGLFELSDVKTLNEKQTELIKRHLNLVFAHEIDPSMGDQTEQNKLNAIHNKPISTNKDNVEPEYGSEEWGIIKFGEKPEPHYVLSTLHGWYDPNFGQPRC